MPSILFLTMKYPPSTAISVRTRYFKEALLANGFDIIVHEIELSTSKVINLLKYVMPHISKELKINAAKVDLIFVTTPPPILPIIAYMLYRELGVKYIVDIRDAWEEYARTMYPAPIVRLIEKRYLKALSQASAITCVTEPLADLYRRKLGMDPLVIPNGTDPSVIKCDDNDHEENSIVVLADFNNPYQELSPLLKALTLLPHINLIVIGNGRYLEKYKREAEELKISNRILWAGHIDYYRLSEFLCRASIGIICRPMIESPAYQLSIPTKTYDYLAAGLPVLGYGPKNAYLQEFLKRYGIGLYIEGNDPTQIARAIKYLLNDAKKLRKKAREVANNYSRPELAKKLINIIKSFM